MNHFRSFEDFSSKRQMAKINEQRQFSSEKELIKDVVTNLGGVLKNKLKQHGVPVTDIKYKLAPSTQAVYIFYSNDFSNNLLGIFQHVVNNARLRTLALVDSDDFDGKLEYYPYITLSLECEYDILESASTKTEPFILKGEKNNKLYYDIANRTLLTESEYKLKR